MPENKNAFDGYGKTESSIKEIKNEPLTLETLKVAIKRIKYGTKF